MKKLALIFVALSSLLLSGCGFHLRGDISLPALFDKVIIVDRGVSDFVQPLKRGLIENSVTIVESTQSATAIITLLSKGVNRRAVAIRGKEVKEYELQISVSFAVQDKTGKQHGETQTVTSVRRYGHNSNRVLGSENEQAMLTNEMREDLVQQIIRRLSKF